MMFLPRHAPLLALAVSFCACGRDHGDVRGDGRSTPTPTSVAAPELPDPPAAASPVRGPSADADLLVLDAATLVELEGRGLAFADVMAGDGITNAELLRSSGLYRDLVASIEGDEAVVRERDPTVGVGFGHSHRAFDTAWLASPSARFELVGVVNRADRRHVDPTGCGEVRFVYRLAYATPVASSRLPMTVNVVAPQRGDCAAVARGWLALRGARALAAALERGPLARRAPVARVEINFQSARWPSAVRPDLGGHAEYVLRVFRVEAGRLVRAPLENTPTVTMGAVEVRELRALLRANVAAIDDGSLLLPERFLAIRSVSASPRGLARLANRPFTQVLGDGARAFRGLPLGELSLARTPAGLLRRLDTMTCKGCHQSRSLAGFHLLGEERDPDARWNALAAGASPHLLGELPYRRAFLEAMARGAEPPPRPFAERAAGEGRLGDACGLGDATFAGWTCGEGARCADRHGEEVGACVPAGAPRPGDPTEEGHVRASTDAHRDRFAADRIAPCEPLDPAGEADAARSGDGFPAGMCHERCTEYGATHGDHVCGPVPFDGGQLFGGFNHCLFRLRRAFHECIADASKPTWLRGCDAERPCRDDYLCSRVPGAAPDHGVCLPPYFLAQLRVDGHPSGPPRAAGR